MVKRGLSKVLIIFLIVFMISVTGIVADGELDVEKFNACVKAPIDACMKGGADCHQNCWDAGFPTSAELEECQSQCNIATEACRQPVLESCAASSTKEQEIEEKEETCYDNIKNQGEEGIDCGGPCSACEEEPEETCYDGMKNQDEEDIDCGGNCPPCEEDTCYNEKQDNGEEGIDCGGPCMERCSFVATLSPSTVTLLADGKAKQEFTLTAKISGSPMKNERFSTSLWLPFRSEVMDNYGSVSPKSITTDENGQATFTYSAPRAPDGMYLENLNFEVRATGKTGAKARINLIDPKPKIIVKLDQKSMLEGEKPMMNYIDVEIIDEDSKEWDIKVTTSIGTLIPTGRDGNFKTLVDKTKERKYNFNWNPPEGGVELIESTLAYVIDHRGDWNNYKSNLKNSAADSALGAPDAIAKVKGYKDQMNTWKGNVDELQRDLNRMKTSTSNFERFIRSLSLGLEGLQTFWATKGFVEGEFDSEEDPLEFLKKIRDNTIDYGIDSLQSGLRYWANLVREGSLDTVRIPVHIIVEVTDDQGFKTKKGEVFQYTYHLI